MASGRHRGALPSDRSSPALACGLAYGMPLAEVGTNYLYGWANPPSAEALYNPAFGRKAWPACLPCDAFSDADLVGYGCTLLTC